jgi:diguanylate cyclase (GGDEF)-like protein
MSVPSTQGNHRQTWIALRNLSRGAGILFALSCFVAATAQQTSQASRPPLTATAPGDKLAQLADLNFDLMGAKQGLPHDSVYAFAQDTRGFLWIASFGGLSRYDGYTLHNFVHSEHDPSSLPDNNIRVVLPGPGGGLWIATGNAGVLTYDPSDGSFHPLPHLPASLQRSHIFCMVSDGSDGIWFGSQLGLAHYSPKTQSYEVFGKAAGKTAQSAAPDFSQGSVFSVLPDSHGNLWVGGDHGLLLRRAGATRFEQIPGLDVPAQPDSFPPVWTIFEDHEGRVWVGTDKFGMALLNRTTNRIEPVPGLSGDDSLIGTATVRGIIEIRKDTFWIATYGSGLITYNAATMRGQRYLRDLTAPAPLSNNFIRSIFLDRTGLVWLGTDRGLSKISSIADGLMTIPSSPLRTDGLRGNEVRSVSAQGDRLWVGFDQGGFAVIEPDGHIRNVAPATGVAPANQSQREVLAIKAADDNTIFAGGQGLYEIDAHRLTYRPVSDPLLAKQVVNALLIDNNDVWAATYNGLVRYNRATHTAKLYAHSVSDAASVSDNYVRDLIKTSDGKLWITTRLGLDLFDTATEKFLHLRHNDRVADSLPSDNIQPIAQDLNGRLWIGTIGDGLTVLMRRDPDGRAHFRTLRREDGFPSNIVLTVMRGVDGRIWSDTPGGLAVVDPNTFRIHTYTAADGLRTSSQNLFTSATLRDGAIVFPGDQGLVVVRPSLLQQNKLAPTLVLTDVAVPGDQRSSAALAWRSADHGILLRPRQRAFEASFALLDFSASGSVRYSYRLDGFDNLWSEPSPARRTATYTNLPPGHYHLLIRAIDHDGIGAMTQIDVPVTVAPSWNQTWWFDLLSAIGLLGLMLLAIRWRTAVIQRRKDALEHEVTLRTAELARKQDELVKVNQQLEELATRDPLTGIFNRRHFVTNADSELRRMRRTGSPFTLLLIDADHFKSVNDRYGHVAGDEVLKHLVRQLSGQMRKSDVIARYGGEELVALLVDTRLQEGIVLAERLREHVDSSPAEFAGEHIPLTISIGAAQAMVDEGIDALLTRADGALYAAKSSGRNQVVAAK